jgi:hypothetical protein
VKIVAMSGGVHNGKLDFLPVASKLGASKLLYKPFGLGSLMTVVSEALATE